MADFYLSLINPKLASKAIPIAIPTPALLVAIPIPIPNATATPSFFFREVSIIPPF